MIGVILAAGMAQRLRPLTDACPKCLLKVGKKTLLARIVEAMVSVGCSELVIVTGYKEEMIRQFMNEHYPKVSVFFLNNADYELNNNIYSLWMAGKLVSGKEFSYDLKWYLTDGYTYYGEDKYLLPAYVTFAEEDSFYYEGLGPEYYEESTFPWSLDDVSRYTGRFLCELDGKLYGYPVAEQEKDFGASEVHMTVKQGIYRFDENGTAECVLPMGERGEDFSFLWLIGTEENHTLTVIGAKGYSLLAYTYDVDAGTIEETVLWKVGEEFTDWMENASMCIKADFVTDGKRMYLCYTDINYNKVRLVVFEEGQRLFEGELLERGNRPDGLKDLSMSLNETTENLSVLDTLEISLVK